MNSSCSGELLCKTSTDTPSVMCGQTLIEIAIIISNPLFSLLLLFFGEGEAIKIIQPQKIGLVSG